MTERKKEREADGRGVERIGKEIADRVDHPREEEEAEGDHSGHDLVRGQARDQEADREEGAREQDQAEVAAVHGTPVRIAVEGEDHRVAGRERQHRRDEGHARHELGEHHLDLAHGRGQEHLEGARLPLLGDEAHGDDGHQEEEEGGHLKEDVRETGQLVEEKDARERVAHEQEEDGNQRVGDRRGEDGALLLAEKGGEVLHAAVGRAGAAPVRSRKSVSRSTDSSRSSAKPKPPSTRAAATRSARSGPRIERR